MTVREFEIRIEQARKIDSPFLTPAQVAPILGWHPHYIRLIAREDPETLPFRPQIRGNRTSFNKVDVILWAEDYLQRLRQVG